MRVLVNGLSLGSLSGRHVLYGHLRQLATAGTDHHEFLVVCQADEPPVESLNRPNVRWMRAPASCRNWVVRYAWESYELPRLIEQRRVDLYFTPNGTVLPRCGIPQVSLAQNPWCLLRGLHRSFTERLKARLQRGAYRTASRRAAFVAYNSEYIRKLYRRNAPGCHEGPSAIVHQAINDETHKRAADLRRTVEKQRWTILSVSAMAHWKGAETLVRATKILHRRGIPAQLQLVGPWPDPAYARLVRREIASHRLGDSVVITGQLAVDELYRRYAEARVFCLMSRCESFGIPAVEAQAFGTPVVASDAGAMPEICGAGGVFGPPDDPEGTAEVLASLLIDARRWRALSEAATANAARYRWEACSRPLFTMFDLGRPIPAEHPLEREAPVQS